MTHSGTNAAAVAVLLCAATLQAADNGIPAFKKQWEGRRVVVQRTLFTLVYDEDGRVGTTRAKRDGLTVITPSKGSYYLFTGRQSQGDVTDADPDRLFDQVKANYRRNKQLEVGFTQTVTPLHLVQYPRGIELVVRRVEMDRTTIRFVLHKPDPPAEFATTLMVQWPAPISSDLHEREPIERVIHQFLQPAP